MRVNARFGRRRNNEDGHVLETTPGDARTVGSSVPTGVEGTGQAVNDHSIIPKEQYGMFIFKDQSPQGDGVVDIVALHGLNSNYEKAWTWPSNKQNERKNWLKDFLPQQIPNARIMSYGYDSQLLFGRSAADISTFAEQLLNDLMAERQTLTEKSRPIIFICHSLGGIVFKKVRLCLPASKISWASI